MTVMTDNGAVEPLCAVACFLWAE